MRQGTFRLKFIAAKDLKVTLRRLPMLLGIYGLYFFIAWFAMRDLEAAISSSVPGQRFFWPLFMIQTVLILTFMLLPQYVYSEAMTEKQETYFAYGYSVLDIVVGKSLVIVLLSLLPALLFSLFVFPELIPKGMLLPFMMVAVSSCVFGLVCLTVFFAWFSRIGRFAVVLLMLLMVLLFSRSRTIVSMAAEASGGVVALALLGVGVVLFVICAFSAWRGRRELFLLKR